MTIEKPGLLQYVYMILFWPILIATGVGIIALLRRLVANIKNH